MSDRVVQLGHQMCSKTAQDARQSFYLAFWSVFVSKCTFPVPNLINFGTGKVEYFVFGVSAVPRATAFVLGEGGVVVLLPLVVGGGGLSCRLSLCPGRAVERGI